MMSIPVGYVAIPLEEYADLVESNHDLSCLLEAIYSSSILSMGEDYLVINSYDVCKVLKAIDRSYGAMIQMVKSAKETDDDERDD